MDNPLKDLGAVVGWAEMPPGQPHERGRALRPAALSS
jgi:hypothetical protein